ncbi:hypothetical protein E2C01_037902 [Portunus trituberculatus]|uniref:Uncharacterized protein n=1 Tax=Portunus trituberculatus TaxID=210409 RepID=A0A5B7FFB1_PORTR|nr:hypothetical protein [Portunus trituberculatus]
MHQKVFRFSHLKRHSCAVHLAGGPVETPIEVVPMKGTDLKSTCSLLRMVGERTQQHLAGTPVEGAECAAIA